MKSGLWLGAFALLSVLLAACGGDDDGQGQGCESEADCTTGFCAASGECVECLNESNCDSGETCNADGNCVAMAVSCSDGTLNGTETDTDCGGECSPCDDGAQCTTGTDCTSGICNAAGVCAQPVCGNGVIEGDEGCDDGNGDNTDSCPDGTGGTCQDATCGDGFTWSTDGGSEGCDDGNGDNTDSCPDGTDGTCQDAVCGDGFTWSTDGGTEGCDDGNGDNTDSCPDGASGTCQNATCGDGFTWSTDGGTEGCDDGNGDNTDSCPDGTGGTCQDATCGDGFTWSTDGGTESCDDANGDNSDSCPDGTGGTCQNATCGDGFTWSTDGGSEGCDDGNQSNNDDCPDGIGGSCQAATCNDGFFNQNGTRQEERLDCSATEATCSACPGSLLLSEFVVAPTAAEFIEVTNTGPDTVSLTNVYLSDFNTYYSEVSNLPANAAAGDFLVRFPAGATLASGATIVISTQSAASYTSHYGAGSAPDFDFDAADLTAAPMTILAAGAPSEAKLGDSEEMIVLFYWDGGDLVDDLDYIVYGNTTSGMDKAGVVAGSSTYGPELPTSMQTVARAPGSGLGAMRCIPTEREEVPSGGNGFLGHVESSESHERMYLRTPTPGSAFCTCGNGVIDGGEQCDPGVQSDDDCCSDTCQFMPNATPCDDGDSCSTGDLCNSFGVCSPINPCLCGNGIVDPGEQCDDGNTLDGDCCDSNCFIFSGTCSDSNCFTVDDLCVGDMCVGGSLGGPEVCDDGCEVGLRRGFHDTTIWPNIAACGPLRAYSAPGVEPCETGWRRCTLADVMANAGPDVPTFDGGLGAWVAYGETGTAETFGGFSSADCSGTPSTMTNLLAAGGECTGGNYPGDYRLQVSTASWTGSHETSTGCFPHVEAACSGDAPLSAGAAYTLCCR